MTKSKKTIPTSEDWQGKANEYMVGWQRAVADFENFKRRADDDKRSFIQFANSDLILSILPILDNFKRAAQHAPVVDDPTVKNWTEGIKAIEKQFETVLADLGVTQIKADTGTLFDPNIHEAMISEESELPADTIVAEIEPGYMLHGRVLRVAKVKVSKG